MKKTLNGLLTALYKKFYWLIILAPGVLFWFFAPALVVDNTSFFASLASSSGRLFAIAMGYGVWVLLPLFIARKSPLIIADKHVKEKVEVLKGKFDGVLKFLKNTGGDNASNLSALPWFLVVGDQRAGKTTLFANSSKKYIFSKKFASVDEMRESKHCAWWVTSEAVYLDVPYVVGRFSKARTMLWLHLLRLLKKFDPRACKGILLVLDLKEVICLSETEYTARLAKIVRQARELSTQQRQVLPLHIVFNKCDKIKGFSEFFNDLSLGERGQHWGFDLKDDFTFQQAETYFSDSLDGLLKRLNEQVIWCMHRERNRVRRGLIKNFPLQFEYIKPKLVQCLLALTRLSAENQLAFQGVYFSSAAQSPEGSSAAENESSSRALSRVSDNQQVLSYVSPIKSYFVDDMLSRIVSHSALKPQNIKTRRNVRFAAVLAFMSAFAGAGVVWANDFEAHLLSVQRAETAIAQYQMIAQKSQKDANGLSSVIESLTSLQEAMQVLKSDSVFGFPLRFVYRVNNDLQTQSKQTYLRVIRNYLIPAIDKTFTHVLADSHASLLDKYTALKALEMVNHPQSIEREFLETALLRVLRSSNIPDPHLVKEVVEELKVFSAKNIPILSDKTTRLINRTKEELRHLSIPERAFIILQTTMIDYKRPPLSLASVIHGDALTLDTSLQSIPYLYTVAGLQEVIPTKLFDAVSQATSGNAVLGGFVPLGKKEELQYSEQTALMYLSRYKAKWNAVLAGVHLRKAGDLQALGEQLQQLLGQSSPVLNFISIVRENTESKYFQSSKSKLKMFNQAFVKAGENYVPRLQQLFALLQSVVEDVNSGQNQDLLAFKFVKHKLQSKSNHDVFSQIQQLSASSPEPIKKWLMALSTKTWELLLRRTAVYVNHEWKSVTASFYSTIKHKYPFKRKAKADLSLKEFTHFFGGRGVFDKFFTRCLTPFIHVKEGQWQIAPGIKQVLGIPSRRIQQLVYAVLVHDMFFPRDQAKPSIMLSFKPIAIDPKLKHFQLTIDGQSVLYSSKIPLSEDQINWPGNSGIRRLTMSFVGKNNKKVSMADTSPWALFHLIAKANPDSKLTDKELFVTFSLRNSAMQYRVTPALSANPFNMALYEHIKLPDVLFEVKS
jgi:type VI secretion system protein ImpL